MLIYVNTYDKHLGVGSHRKAKFHLKYKNQQCQTEKRGEKSLKKQKYHAPLSPSLSLLASVQLLPSVLPLLHQIAEREQFS